MTDETLKFYGHIVKMSSLLPTSFCWPIFNINCFAEILKIYVTNLQIIFTFGSAIPLLLEILKFCKKNLKECGSVFLNLFPELRYL